MKSLLLLGLISLSSVYASAKDYQVTGTVVEVTDSKIVVDKKGEKFEVNKTAAVKNSGAAATVGSKVTVYYTMTATEIEAKAAGKEEKKKKTN